MRFKATMGSALQLSKLLQTLDKVAETCIVHLTPELIQFGVAATEGKDNLHVCADVNQRSLFFEYSVQSKAKDNRISFFVKTENLSRALRSCCANATEHIQLKLTKKQGTPALSFEITMQDSNVQVMHEVPIRLVSDPTETLAYAEPSMGESDSAVAVIFPSRDFKGLKNVVERMRSVNDWMRITTRRGGSGETSGGGGGDVDGSGSASLELRVEKPELVSIKTTYPRLGVPMSAPAEDDDGPNSPVETGAGGGVAAGGADGGSSSAAAAGGGGGGRSSSSSKDEASASVEVRKLLRVLTSLSSSDLKINNAIVCVVPGVMVILKIYLQDDTGQSFMIYYLPVLAGADDD